RYHVRYYDSQDWDQDALIVCYRAVQKFNDNKGRFGSYYKTLLTNHAKSLVRYDAAYRRRALTQAISLENAAAEGLSPLRQNFAQTAAVPLSENLKELVAHLSNLELSALLLALGTMKYEEIKRKYHFSRLMLVRARARVLQKMRRLLLS
ncbi:sigma-70 family RNA polymerase sigma factor, partial [Lactobacillus sp. XV13L]|nr:sigma-70 family RNA polymerase sigma factor [Lactobacillus sp. XV13L]